MSIIKQQLYPAVEEPRLMKVLITLKSIAHSEKFGGIRTYYMILETRFSMNVQYFHFSHINRSNSLKNLPFRLRDIFAYSRKCYSKKQGFSIIHLNPSLSWSSVSRDGLFLLIANHADKKTIIFFHGWHEYMARLLDKYFFFRWLFKKIYCRTDAVIVLSGAFRQKLRDWGFQQKIYVETTVVDDNLIKDAPGNDLRCWKSYIDLLFLARIERAKGVYELLDIFKIIKNRHPPVRLTIAGDGSQLERVKKSAAENGLNDLVFTGYITGKEKAAVFARSDIYILPTHGEGMPLSVLEAMAFGLPVVTRPVGGLKDFFQHGEMGYITESKDPNVFAQFVSRLITNPDLLAKISGYNAQFAKNNFMASNVAPRLEAIYQDVLAGTQKNSSWRDSDPLRRKNA